MFKKLQILSLMLVLPIALQAQSYTGKIHTIHAGLNSSSVHVQFEGPVLFDVGDCQSYFTGNLMADDNFRFYLYPLLLAAKATGEEVTLYLVCEAGVYPKIYALDAKPRL